SLQEESWRERSSSKASRSRRELPLRSWLERAPRQSNSVPRRRPIFSKPLRKQTLEILLTGSSFCGSFGASVEPQAPDQAPSPRQAADHRSIGLVEGQPVEGSD